VIDVFPRIERLPPYVFNIVNQLKAEARARGEDIIDFGMGNPDQPTPQHIVDKLVEVAQRGDTHRYSVSKGIPRLRRAICALVQGALRRRSRPGDRGDRDHRLQGGPGAPGAGHLGPGDAVLVPNPAYPIHPYGFVIAGADIRHVPLTRASTSSRN
jgi:alanine-synthesizing transaminase